MAVTDSEEAVENGTGGLDEDIDEKSEERLSLMLVLDLVGLAVVDPVGVAVLLLQSHDEDVDIVLPSEDVFVRIDEIVGERVADTVEGVPGV